MKTRRPPGFAYRGTAPAAKPDATGRAAGAAGAKPEPVRRIEARRLQGPDHRLQFRRHVPWCRIRPVARPRGAPMERHHVFWALHGAIAAGAVALAIFARRQVLGFAATGWILCGLLTPLFYGRSVSLELVWLAVALGPLTAPFWLAGLALKFPLIAIPVFVVAAYVSYLILAGFDLLKPTSLSALVGVPVFAVLLLAGAEGFVTLIIRARAAEQSEGAYCLDQMRVLEMLRETTRLDRKPHATLVDGDATYMWSFAELRFVPQTNDLFVVAGGEAACRAGRRDQRRPNSFSMSASFSST
jgi:hypothetical protein